MAQLKTQAVVKRVPTKACLVEVMRLVRAITTFLQDNVADLPSREEYSLLEAMRAVRVPAILDDAFCRPTAWESLSMVSWSL